MRSGEIDIGFIEGFINDPKFETHPWDDDELIAVVSDKDAYKKKYKIDELAEYKWILREKGSGTRAVFESGLGEHFAVKYFDARTQ